MDGAIELQDSAGGRRRTEEVPGVMASGSDGLNNVKADMDSSIPGADGGNEDPALNTPPISACRPSPTPSDLTRTTHQLREFHLTADISHFNHRAYIERQPHCAGFSPDQKSIAAEDLAQSAPLLGLSNLCLRKAEVPMRVINKRSQELAQRKTLTELWEEGIKG